MMKRRSLQSVIKNKLKLNHVTNNNNTSDSHSSNDDKTTNRASSQRLSLFKYPHVEVKTSSDDYMSGITTNSNGKLLARGPIEIYEMRTISSRSFFLSVGRHGEWIHPMLPKLKIRRVVDSIDFNLFVSFSNPDRIWKIQFIECDELHVDTDMIQDLETVITGICQYSCVKSLQSGKDVKSVKVLNDDDDNNELNYLLESDTSEDDELTDVEMIESINDVFRKAMNNVIPPWESLHSKNTSELHVPKVRQEPSLPRRRKRISLYMPNSNEMRTSSATMIVDTTSINKKNFNRRSISVFSDYETLISLQNLKL